MKTVLVLIGVVIVAILISADYHIYGSDSVARAQVKNLWLNFFSTIGSMGVHFILSHCVDGCCSRNAHGCL